MVLGLTGFVASTGSAMHDFKDFYLLTEDLKKGVLILSKYEVVQNGSKSYIKFKGNHKLRSLVKGTRYLSNNAKMIALGIGKAGMRASAKAGVFITVVYSVVFRTLELALTKNYSVTNWIVHVGSDVVKAALAAFFGCFVGSFALTSGVVLFPIGLGIFVAFVSGLILETLEGRYLNKERIIKSINHKIEETISGDISKINRDVEIQRSVSQMTPILVGGL